MVYPEIDLGLEGFLTLMFRRNKISVFCEVYNIQTLPWAVIFFIEKKKKKIRENLLSVRPVRAKPTGAERATP